MMKIISFLIFLLLAAHTLAAPESYQNQQAKYEITYDHHWKIHQPATSSRVLVLVCATKDCDPNSQLIISHSHDPALVNLDNDYFMKNLPPKTVRSLLTSMIEPIGKLQEITYLRRSTIGRFAGYRAQLRMQTYKGGTKIMLYGLTFNHGNFYHLQFFASERGFTQDLALANQVFESFRISD